MGDTTSDAILRIGRIVRDRRAHPERPNRPLGLFLLVGPDEALLIASTVAETIFGDSEAVLRLDMSVYKEKHDITLLVGPPPGIVGYGPPGRLPEPIRLRPDQVILLERIELAHDDAQALLLHIVEEGDLFDNYGRRVEFRGTIILLTTEAGVSPERVIRPELLGRIDDMFSFDETRPTSPTCDQLIRPE